MDGDNNGGEGDLGSFPKIGEVCLNRLLLWPVLSTALKFAAILDKSSETPPTEEGNFEGDDGDCFWSDGGDCPFSDIIF